MAGESWDPPSDAALTTGNVGLSAHILAIRDLAAALAARATGAPWLNAVGDTEHFTSSASWVVPAGVTRCRLTILGGGGAGGAGIDNNAGASDPGAGGGGGAGGITFVSNLTVTPAESITVTVGTGGAGGAGTGGAGVASSVVRTASWSYSANGGAGGVAGTAGSGGGGAGGVAAFPGYPGAKGEDGLRVGPELATSAWQGISGAGAASFIGGGAPAIASSGITSNKVGNAATAKGAGGSGGYAVLVSGTMTRNGGDGADGIVLIEF